MNDILNLSRFGWLIRKVFLEKTALVLGSMLLCFIVTFIFYGMTMLLQGISEAQNDAFLVGLTLGGALMASVVFGYFNNDATGVSFLTLPASVLEKWLSGIVIIGLYFLLFLVYFRLIDLAFVAQYHNNLNTHAPYYKEQYELVNIIPFTGSTAAQNFMMFFNFTGIMMLGALFFNKAAFIKTALVICSILVAAFLLNLLIINLLIKNVQTAFPFTVVWLWIGKERAQLELSPENADKAKIIFRFVLPAVLWALSLLRLKEKEF
jgi:hypothetical protein